MLDVRVTRVVPEGRRIKMSWLGIEKLYWQLSGGTE
jgi:hypothetical protein